MVKGDWFSRLKLADVCDRENAALQWTHTEKHREPCLFGWIEAVWYVASRRVLNFYHFYQFNNFQTKPNCFGTSWKEFVCFGVCKKLGSVGGEHDCLWKMIYLLCGNPVVWTYGWSGSLMCVSTCVFFILFYFIKFFFLLVFYQIQFHSCIETKEGVEKSWWGTKRSISNC